MFIDLNADLGEGGDFDSQLMPLITSANIACGGHAGNVDSMRAAVHLAHQHGVRIGAHPSYPDRAHFGRRSMVIEPSKLVFSLTAQLWALKAVCIEDGISVAYVKPQGALYHDAMVNPVLADQIAQLIYEIDPDLAVMALAGSCLIEAAQARGLATISEGFADRAYLPDGTLMPLAEPKAVLSDLAEIQIQALSLVGQVQSLCIHGDQRNGLQQTFAIRQYLQENGVNFAVNPS
ncbi:LamB/YcsF family protein [Deefgea rivuli]|uniref:LamB/YcsF family protein n=1 Tax=Deefgea rivuli TaxID=400948 RepID=UPI00056AEE83|nr:LamB/YcsF family protein [Deefgea rivuli]